MPQDDLRIYHEERKGSRKVGSKKVSTSQESHWSGPGPMPEGDARPGHFKKDPEE